MMVLALSYVSRARFLASRYTGGPLRSTPLRLHPLRRFWKGRRVRVRLSDEGWTGRRDDGFENVSLLLATRGNGWVLTPVTLQLTHGKKILTFAGSRTIVRLLNQ